MNSFELNKIFGAILGTLVFVMGVGFIADEIYRPIEGRGASYTLPEPETGGEAGAEAPGVPSIEARMQTASADAGAGLIVRCQSCHDYSEANANRTGPGLFGVVGNPIAHHEGFSYSAALQELGDAGEIWDYQHLDEFLESPRTHAPGTTMSFAGLSNPDDRADLIEFLRQNDSDPFPLPEAPAEDEAPAEGDEAAEGDAAEEAPADDELTAALASATADQGQALYARCQSCHDISPANANRVGPGLYGIVGAEIAHHDGYGYSDALASLGAEGEIWSPENLSAFLEAPAQFAPGTRMAFPGLASVEDRAALIVYLNEQSEAPIDLGGGAAAPADDAAAEDEAPADQPALEEAEQLTLGDEAQEEDAPVVDGEAPQADPTPQTDNPTEGSGEIGEMPVGGEVEIDNAPETGTTGN